MRFIDIAIAIPCVAGSAVAAGDITGVSGLEERIFQYGALGAMVIWFMLRDTRRDRISEESRKASVARIQQLEDKLVNVLEDCVNRSSEAEERFASGMNSLERVIANCPGNKNGGAA